MTEFEKLLLERIDSVAARVDAKVEGVKDHVTTESRSTRELIAKNSERIAVLESRQPPKARQLARDGGLTISGAGLTVGIMQLIEWLTKAAG